MILTAGLVAVVLPLIQGRQLGWPGGRGSAWAWLRSCWGDSYSTSAGWPPPVAPPGDLALFRDRTFSAGLITQLGLWFGQASFFLVLALYLQQGKGLDALQSGLVFTVMASAYVVASVRAPALTQRLAAP